MSTQLELFTKVDRTTRQRECQEKWVHNKCVGTIVGATGFGKTRVGLNCLEMIIKKFPQWRAIVVVPTDTLQKQWKQQVDERGLGFNTEVLVINTAIKQDRQCNLLILDKILSN